MNGRIFRLHIKLLLGSMPAAAFTGRVIRPMTTSPQRYFCSAMTNLPSTTQAPSFSALKHLQPVDELKVTVIVDNEVDSMSTRGIMEGIDGFQYLPNKSSSAASGAAGLCRAAHGLSLLLTTTTATAAGSGKKETHSIVLDAGPTPELWKENADKLNLDLAQVEVAVLSHYHYDHSGGLTGAVPAIVEAQQRQQRNANQPMRPLQVDLHSSGIIARGRLQDKDAGLKDDNVIPHIPNNPSAHELANLGAQISWNDQEHLLCDKSFYVSGPIRRDFATYETGIPNHVTRKDGHWTLDPDIAEERYVVCWVKHRGLVLFSSCSHAGINNICRDVQAKTRSSIFGLMGGLHLAGAGGVEDRIPRTVADLKTCLSPKSIVLAGHCTGWRGKAALAASFPGQFQPLAVGATYIFSSTSS